MLDDIMEQVMERVMMYCSKDETRATIEEKLLGPLVRYLAIKFQAFVYVFQAIAILVSIQTILLAWLLLRSFKGVTT
jgi:hypothetical protein